MREKREGEKRGRKEGGRMREKRGEKRGRKEGGRRREEGE